MRPGSAAIFLIVAVIAATIPAARAETSPELDGWTIAAGRIKVEKGASAGDVRRVRGTFELASLSDEPGTRRAGACLLADLTGQMVGKSTCTHHDECQSDHRVVPPNAPAGSVNTSELLFGGEGHSYCISADGTEPKRCWTRPGPDAAYCTKGQHAPGKLAVPPSDPASGAVKSVSADPLGNGKPVRWLVYGCLNPELVDPPPALPPCADPLSDREVNSVGRSKRVKP